MSKELAFVTVHGMGETRRNYWRGLGGDLRKELGGDRWSRLEFIPIYYQHILQPRQRAVWRRMRAKDLEWTKGRKFVLFGFSDAASIEHKAEKAGSVYEQVQGIILGALDEAFDHLGDPAAPVIILAQSLGCQVISNYIWDANTPGSSLGIWRNGENHGETPGSPRDEFRRLRTLRFLFTTGCNIPIFVAGHDPIRAIPRPSAKFEWHNFYDNDDILGWPLKPLSDSYRSTVTKDIEVNVGGWLSNWNPASHTHYWTDSDVVRRIADLVRGLLP